MTTLGVFGFKDHVHFLSNQIFDITIFDLWTFNTDKVQLYETAEQNSKHDTDNTKIDKNKRQKMGQNFELLMLKWFRIMYCDKNNHFSQLGKVSAKNQ